MSRARLRVWCALLCQGCIVSPLRDHNHRFDRVWKFWGLLHKPILRNYQEIWHVTVNFSIIHFIAFDWTTKILNNWLSLFKTAISLQSSLQEVAPTTLVIFFSYVHELWPTKLNVENDTGSVIMNQSAKYLGQRSASSKLIVSKPKHTQTHTSPIALPGLVKWSVNMLQGEDHPN